MSVARPPSREELEALVRHYHHVESEHEHARAEGSVRHHLELPLQHDRERFEHLLREYMIEIRRDESGELAVEVDSSLVERLPGRQVPIDKERPAVFRLDGTAFREQFQVSRDALAALRDFSALGGDPPWEHASSLLADGLVDVDFGITSRGRRALTPRLGR